MRTDSESSCTPGEGGYAARRRRLINGASRHLSSLGLLSGVSVSFAALLYGRLSVSQLPPKGRHWGHQQNTGVTAAPPNRPLPVVITAARWLVLFVVPLVPLPALPVLCVCVPSLLAST